MGYARECVPKFPLSYGSPALTLPVSPAIGSLPAVSFPFVAVSAVIWSPHMALEADDARLLTVSIVIWFLRVIFCTLISVVAVTVFLGV